MTDATPIIETQDLRKVYSPGTQAEVVALDGVSLRIGRGEFVAIMGASGSGKSTLMNLIGCLDRPSSGRYLCDGVDVASLDSEQLARLRLEKIGFVFQGFNLLSSLPAWRNVELPLVYGHVPREDRKKRASRALGPLAPGSHSPAATMAFIKRSARLPSASGSPSRYPA